MECLDEIVYLSCNLLWLEEFTRLGMLERTSCLAIFCANRPILTYFGKEC